MNRLKNRRPSPAMVVAMIALIVALAGTAYAAQTINGGAIKKQTIGGGKLKQKTLTGFQINTNKLGVVPAATARRPHLLGGRQQPGRRGQRGARPGERLRRSPRPRAAARSAVAFPQNVSGCANVAGRNNAGTSVPGAGYAQTNTSAANPNAIEVRTRDESRRQRGRRLPPDRRLPIAATPPTGLTSPTCEGVSGPSAAIAARLRP